MSGETLAVKARDEHSFEGQLYVADSPTAPLLIFMPAMGTPARYYAPLGEAMARAGLSFFVFDWRGMESSSIRPSRQVDFGYRELIEEDIPGALIAVRKRLKQAPIWVGGHSLGGQLACCFAARAPAGIEGIVLIASGNVHYRGWQGPAGAGGLAVSQTPSLISRVLASFPGMKPGFAGNEARSLMRDWADVVRTGRYRIPGAIFDYEAALPRLKKPLLSLGFHGDKLAPAAAAQSLLGKLPECEKTVWQWSMVETGGIGFDHFSWVRDPGKVVPDVSGWILANTGKRPAFR